MSNDVQRSRQPWRIHFLWHILAIPMLVACVSASHVSAINCTNMVCPSMADVSCPLDSFLRTLNKPAIIESDDLEVEITDEEFDTCCLTAKCGCRTCFIEECKNASLVIYEKVPESQIPGQCCGEYDCIEEPDCAVVRDTPGKWLTDCQRCECVSGERICHRSCDEAPAMPVATLCKAKNSNRFYAPGETWKDGCADCECINGEEKCMIPFCKRVECANARQVQVTLPDHCCPVCYPDLNSWQYIGEGAPTTQPPPACPEPPPAVVTNAPPMTYSVYTEEVEVIRDRTANIYWYVTTFVLFIMLLTVVCKYIHLRSKYRSSDGGSITSKKYSPVPIEVAK